MKLTFELTIEAHGNVVSNVVSLKAKRVYVGDHVLDLLYFILGLGLSNCIYRFKCNGYLLRFEGQQNQL